MIRSSQNPEGFIRNPWSKENDAMHIDTFFKRIDKDASKRCGCHYEIYEQFRIDNLLDALYKLETLNKSHAEYVRKLAASHGYDLSEEGQQQTEQAYNETMSEIRREQE
ncbi:MULTISPECIES: hypothetical protein [Enterobacteriaceae]|uniref:hypothetical protein n=1 Tax=Enterobacteriaceae TaxID=543 RepID=UPI000BE559FE|nr:MULTISPECIES: hypothetical protein [Enterobacteriaceae]EAA9186594.1 hypothetical protein [Salmonella enterica]MBU4685539.1 hypothetical protein [Cedecea davisae]MDH1753908.1 hypothetical protein [Citrobacter freundii]HCQ8318518.1 hypothetical protein [Klebsiella pneumoniae]